MILSQDLESIFPGCYLVVLTPLKQELSLFFFKSEVKQWGFYPYAFDVTLSSEK
jgi:hypothetical protein